MELQKAIITEFRLKKVTWRSPIKEKTLAISRKCFFQRGPGRAWTYDLQIMRTISSCIFYYIL